MGKIQVSYDSKSGSYKATIFGQENVAYGDTKGSARDALVREIRHTGNIQRIIHGRPKETICGMSLRSRFIRRHSLV